MRMLMNNLDPDVAERPEDLVVYGGTGRAARSWEAYDAIVGCLVGHIEPGRDREAEPRVVGAGVRRELPEAGALVGVVRDAPVGAMLRVVLGRVHVRVQAARGEEGDRVDPSGVRPRRPVEPFDDAPHGEGATHRTSVPSHEYAPAPSGGDLTSMNGVT